MKFNKLNIRAFGHFTDYEIQFDSSKNFHLIYGPNEAGKSTTLRSITNLLYGFPQQTTDSFMHSNSKLRIEGELTKQAGESLFFARRKGNKNTVLDENGNPINEELVNQFLNGLSEKQFLNMFALDHVRLREGGEGLLQSGGSVGESLFSAASGINILRKVFEDLEKKSADIYKKRASTTKLNKLIKEQKDLLKEISEYQLKIQSWKELERTYLEGKQEIEALIKQVKSLNQQQEKLKRVKLTLPKIARLRVLEQQLAEIGPVPHLPENSKVVREEAQQRLVNGKRDWKRAEDQAREIETEMEQISIPSGLIDQAAVIDALYRELQSYQNSLAQIPRLEGEKKQLETRILSLMKEIDDQYADIENIDRFRLPAEKKETIRELAKRKPLLDQAHEKIKSEQNDITDELNKKQDELAGIGELPDINELENVIDRAKRAGQIEETLKDLFKEITEKEQQITEEMKRLPLWDGTVQQLMELQVPGLTETVRKYEQERNELVLKLQKLGEQIRLEKDAIERHEDRIRTLESLAEIPSEDKLLNIRAKRDKGWQLIRHKLVSGEWDDQAQDFTKGASVETVYEENVRNADDIADKMRLEAAKVGEKNKLLSDIDSCQKKIADLENQEIAVKAGLVQWEKAWRTLWEPAQIIPWTPMEMKEWLEKYHYIKGLVMEYGKTKGAHHELESKRDHLCQALLTVLSKFVSVSEEKTFDDLLILAEQKYKKIRDDIYKKNSLEESVNDFKKKAKALSLKHIEIETSVREWQASWGIAIQGTNISVSTPANVAEKLLARYDESILTYEDLNKVEKNLKSVHDQTSNFSEKVRNLLQKVPYEQDDSQLDIAVNQLNTALKKAQQDEVAILNLKEQLKKLYAVMKDAKNEMDEADTILKRLIQQAGCTNVQELEEVERKFTLKSDVEAKLTELKEELLNHGNGRSLQELTQEADETDRDRLEVELEEIACQLEELDPKRSQLEREHGVVKKEYEEKIQGNNTASVLAEQKKESLLAQLGGLTEQYIQLKLASTLLQKGIEYYQNQNQDPILQRASILFSRLTLQSFVGLTVDYDDKDQPVLMGVRENGEKVFIDGMSDGTTDQLYLSLRIASIEKYASENEPIPFIVDDILVHFDDIRSKETLKILLELAKHTQIIFFTHHARLVDIMNDLVKENDYQLIEINNKHTVVV